MIAMLAGAWLYSRHGRTALLAGATTWGAMDLINATVRHFTGNDLVEVILTAIGAALVAIKNGAA